MVNESPGKCQAARAPVSPRNRVKCICMLEAADKTLGYIHEVGACRRPRKRSSRSCRREKAKTSWRLACMRLLGGPGRHANTHVDSQMTAHDSGKNTIEMRPVSWSSTLTRGLEASHPALAEECARPVRIKASVPRRLTTSQVLTLDSLLLCS